MLKRLIKIALSLLILAGLVWWAGLQNLVTALAKVELWFVAPGVAVYLFAQWLSACRWQGLAKVIGFEAPRSTFVDGYLLGMVCSLFLPSSIGGDAVRTLLLARQCGKRKREAVLTLLAERGVGLMILLWLTALASLWPTVRAVMPLPLLQGVWLASGGLLLGWVALYALPIQHLAEKHKIFALAAQAQPYWQNPGVLARSLGLSVIVQGLMVVLHLGMAAVLGIFPAPMDVPTVTVAYGLAQLAGVLPVAFAGFGLREGTYQAITGFAGVPAALGLAYGLYWALILLSTTAVAGAWLVWRRPDLMSWVKTQSPEDESVADTPAVAATAG